MNTYEFKIRLKMYSYSDVDSDTMYVDELDETSQNLICDKLMGAYDWLDRTDGYTKGSEDYIWQQKLMSYNGFTNEDVTMSAEFKNGKLNVALVTDKNWNDMRDVNYYGDKSFSMSLLDCVKNVINGQLSDGIGENELGSIVYKDEKYDIWLAEIECDDELEENRIYFKVRENEM